LILEVPSMKEQGKETVVTEKDEEVNSVDEEQIDETSADSDRKKLENEAEIEYQNEIDTLTEQKDQLQDRMLRLQAEFENYKRRTEKERIAERKYKSQDLASELLPILDNFERALQTE